MAMASYVQAVGASQAQAEWESKADAVRYSTYLSPYLAFAPATYPDYFPGGYSGALPNVVTNAAMVTLTGPDGGAIAY